MAASVQAPALASLPGVTCSVELATADALGVGHSIRALIKSGMIPISAIAPYERVATQMIAAARLSLAGAK